MLEAEVAIGIEDVFSGPIAVVEEAPGGVVVVLNDQPAEFVLFGSRTDFVDVLFKIELGSVYSKDGEPVVFVALMPCPQGRPRVLAVVSSVGPKIDKDDLAGFLEIPDGSRSAIQPLLCVSQSVVGAFV